MKKVLLASLLGVVLLSGCGSTESEAESASPESSEVTTQDTEGSKDRETLVAERDYLVDLQESLALYESYSGDMSTYFLDAGDDISHMYDEEWREDVALNIFLIDEVLTDIEDLDPPEEYKEFHGYYLDFVEDMRFTTTNIPVAIDNEDFELIRESTEKMNEANQHIQEANDYFDTITE